MAINLSFCTQVCAEDSGFQCPQIRNFWFFFSNNGPLYQISGFSVKKLQFLYDYDVSRNFNAYIIEFCAVDLYYHLNLRWFSKFSPHSGGNWNLIEWKKFKNMQLTCCKLEQIEIETLTPKRIKMRVAYFTVVCFPTLRSHHPNFHISY